MAYNISLMSPADRRFIINNSVEASSKTEDFYDYRNTRKELKVIRVAIDLPIYRIENFRTFTDQSEYIKEKNLALNFFRAGQESESIQQLQHEILANLARKGKDSSINAVIDVLRKEKQREPLLITTDGVVVNGNRRLAAMRELSTENTTDNDAFQYIDVMVLPNDATPDDILDIEASLQGKPETKLEYDWIGDAQLVKSQLNIHKSFSNVSRRLNRSERDIKNTLLALNEADLYLKEWKENEGNYLLVKEDAEQFFKDLPKHLDGKNSQLENISRTIAWRLFENKDMLPGRIYDFNAAFGKLAEDVVNRFSEKMGLDDIYISSDDDDDSFSINIEETSQEKNYEPIIETLKDRENEEALSFLVESVIDSIESAKGQKSGDAALKAVQQANSKLASVDLSKANPETYPVIEKQLEHIHKLTEKIQVKISELLENK